MKNILYIVFGLFVASSTLVFIDLALAIRIKFMEMLGVGLIFAKFAIDYYKNRQAKKAYLKYAIYSALAFIIFVGALVSNTKVPYIFTNALLMLSLLVFSMIGLNSSMGQYQQAQSTRSKNNALFYIIVFAAHGLAAFVAATAYLKDLDLLIVLPIVIGLDVIVLLPYIVAKRAYDQFLLLALIVVSLSINSFLLLRSHDYSPLNNTETVPVKHSQVNPD